MKRTLMWLSALLAVVLLGVVIGRAALNRRADPPPAVATQQAVLELEEQDVVRLRMRALVRSLEVSGSLRAVDSAIVKAKVAAELRELGVREGDPVRAGQVIGRLDDTEYAARLQQAQQQAASARAQLDIAERTLANNRALVDRGFISRNALDTSVSNAAAARASLLAAQATADIARKASGDTVLRAPISGQVLQRLAQPGERVAIDGRIVEIVDLSRIEFETPVAPEDVAAVTIGASARLRVDGVAEPVSARVVRIAPGTQAGTRAVMAYLAVDAHPALRHGLFATGLVELGRLDALAVPESALRTDRVQPYLLVVQGERIARRDVETGARGRDAESGEALVALDSGVREGDAVLAGSVGLVRDGAAVTLTRAR